MPAAAALSRKALMVISLFVVVALTLAIGYAWGDSSRHPGHAGIRMDSGTAHHMSDTDMPVMHMTSGDMRVMPPHMKTMHRHHGGNNR